MGGLEIIIFVVMIGGMMWFMGRSSKKQRQRMEDERDSAIVVGANVMTTSGFFGTIVSIDGDAITLESPSGDETVWLRQAIRGIAEIPLAPISEEEDAQLDAEDSAQAPEARLAEASSEAEPFAESKGNEGTAPLASERDADSDGTAGNAWK